MPIAFISLFIILAVGLGLLAAVGLLFRRKGLGTALGAMAATFGGLLLIGLFLAYSRASVSHQRQAMDVVARQEAALTVQAHQQAVLASATPWVPTAVLETQQQMYASLYPSVDSAAASLVGRLSSDRVQALIQDKTDFVIVKQEDLSDSMASRLVRGLQEIGVPREQIRMGLLDADTNTGTGSVLIQYEDADNTQHLTLTVDGLPHVLSAAYTQQGWVEDVPGYQSGHPDVTLYRGLSPLVDSAEEAKRLAVAHLQVVLAKSNQGQAVVEVVNDQIEVHRWEGEGTGEDTKKTQVYEVDRTFLQSFDRPYGTLWRQAVLIDSGPDEWRSQSGGHGPPVVRTLPVSNQSGPEARTYAYLATKFRAVATMVGFIVVLYFLLNAITKGYFRGKIMLILGALLLLVMLFMSFFGVIAN